jgi:hypothetical protein
VQVRWNQGALARAGEPFKGQVNAASDRQRQNQRDQDATSLVMRRLSAWGVTGSVTRAAKSVTWRGKSVTSRPKSVT